MFELHILCDIGMGSFQHTNLEQIGKASVITELETQREREVLPSFNTIGASPETWAVAFAPDHSYFAWSCGNRIVKLVPWDKDRRNIFSNINREHNLSPDQRSEASERCPDQRSIVTIPCKDLVWSLAFGWSVPNKKSRRCSQSYRLFGYLEQDDDLILAIGLKSGKIKTYNVGKGEHFLLVDHKSVVRDLRFTPDGSLFLVSASLDTTLKVWDLKDDGNMVASMKGHPKAVYGCAFSPDCSLLASVGEQRTVIVWNFKTYKMLRKLQGHHNHVTACEFSVDGAMLATASYDTRVILWDPHTGEVLSQFSHVFPILSPVFAGGSNSHFVRDICFSPDGLHFATVCDDNLARVWSILDNRDPVLVSSLQEPLTCTFNPDGSVLAAGTRKGSVQFVAVPGKQQSLQHLSRMALRRFCHDYTKFAHLDIPDVLRRYIGYRDLRTEITTEE